MIHDKSKLTSFTQLIDEYFIRACCAILFHERVIAVGNIKITVVINIRNHHRHR